MKYISPLLALSAVANAAHFSKEQYESGEVHQRIIDMKNVCSTNYGYWVASFTY
jgi:hypothetical protein